MFMIIVIECQRLLFWKGDEGRKNPLIYMKRINSDCIYQAWPQEFEQGAVNRWAIFTIRKLVCNYFEACIKRNCMSMLIDCTFLPKISSFDVGF